jgi:ornithine cyclodeaminase/alanine dehydrogenase-like protein (mu-crystallin family)
VYLMQTLMVNHKEVEQWLPMGECMDVMAETLKMLSRGNAVNPLRHAMWLPDKSGLIGMMPAYLGDTEVMGLKAISVFPGNHTTDYDSHQGTVILFETVNGRLLALMDASKITAIRTAAVSGVATRLLAREDASDLAILGSGVQAETHLEAMRIARQITGVRVWSQQFAHAQKFADQASAGNGIPISAFETVKEAVDGADIICTVTSATEPILQGDWISPGTHINAVGSSVAFARELDTAAVAKSKLFVDRRESTLNEAGDFLFPKKEGAIDDGHIRGEIGDILLDRIGGRASSEEITLFKSLGLAAEDVAAAHYIYQKLVKNEEGMWVAFGALKSE